uniref:FAT domain-containing protein n=1 Tax=Rhabditophanes sp. KR3021 TaxID=114890 RepID=A0AC35UC99_9BILA
MTSDEILEKAFADLESRHSSWQGAIDNIIELLETGNWSEVYNIPFNPKNCSLYTELIDGFMQCDDDWTIARCEFVCRALPRMLMLRERKQLAVTVLHRILSRNWESLIKWGAITKLNNNGARADTIKGKAAKLAKDAIVNMYINEYVNSSHGPQGAEVKCLLEQCCKDAK